jgi:hypothetical protein
MTFSLVRETAGCDSHRRSNGASRGMSFYDFLLISITWTGSFPDAGFRRVARDLPGRCLAKAKRFLEPLDGVREPDLAARPLLFAAAPWPTAVCNAEVFDHSDSPSQSQAIGQSGGILGLAKER